MNLPMKHQAPQSLLPALDLSKPASILSLLRWLSDALGGLSEWGDRILVDGVRRHTLPTSLKLSGPMRAALEARIAELEAAATPGPEEDAELKIAEMVRFFSANGVSRDVVSVKIDVYMQAVGHLPAWAIIEAVRRWYGGAAGAADEDYRFAPGPGVLAKVAQHVANIAAGQIVSLRRLLEAVPYDDMDERQREAAQRKFAGLLTGATVGKVQGTREASSETYTNERKAMVDDLANRASRRAKEGEAA